MTDETDETRVAIACQGGGSLTAYTAGVLDSLLTGMDRDERVVGLSGTSGGAICATLAWYGLLEDGPERATDHLLEFWADVAARDPLDQLYNEMLVDYVQFEEGGVPTPGISPYQNPWASYGQRLLESKIERRVDFDRLDDLRDDESPELFVGAVNVSNDAFTVFHGSDMTARKVLASTALPKLFPAVEVDGEMYWDGLFSENPPIRSLVTTDPDELWVIQVNPQKIDHVPTTLKGIYDRRDELSGNLSLNQELYFIKKLNELIDEGSLVHEGYKHVDVERIVIGEHYGYAEKLDRDREFIEDLVAEGKEDGEAFVEGRGGRDEEAFVDDHRSLDYSA